jgi:hypothetical protein
MAAVRELYTELGYGELGSEPSEEWLRGSHGELWEGCAKAEDGIVLQMREELARLAHAAQGDDGRQSERAVQAALDGAELVMRSEIAAQRPEMIGIHLPGFTFMVALPGLGHEGALKVSQRTVELLGGKRSES